MVRSTVAAPWVPCAPTYVAACAHELTAVSRDHSVLTTRVAVLHAVVVVVVDLLPLRWGPSAPRGCWCVRGYPVAAGVPAAHMRIGRRTHARAHRHHHARVRVHECVPTHTQAHTRPPARAHRSARQICIGESTTCTKLHTRSADARTCTLVFPHRHTLQQAHRHTCTRTHKRVRSYSTRASDLRGLPQVWQRVQGV